MCKALGVSADYLIGNDCESVISEYNALITDILEFNESVKERRRKIVESEAERLLRRRNDV